MNIKLRLFIAFFILFGAGLYYVFDTIISEIRPRYFETVEESMNDTVNILAALIEQESSDGSISLSKLTELTSVIYQRRFTAKIYSHTKSAVDLQFYICDKRGIVIFDSRNGERVGRDFSRWNDVYLALRGKYGARSSKISSNDEGLLYVSAPVRSRGEIIGSVTVEKTKDSVASFIQLARKKVIVLGLASFAAFSFISIILSFWITSPIKRLTVFINSLKDNQRAVPPGFSGREINELASAFERVFTELNGKKYIENYVDSLAHEIKSPLSSIKSAAELMTEELPDEQKQKFLSNILRESSRIHFLIEKMLLLSSLENREGLKSAEIISACEVIADVADALAPQAEKLRIVFILMCDDKLTFEGEYFLIRHSLLNLADNALKNSPADSSVEISCCISDNTVIFSVRDHGAGIPDYAAARVFDKFYAIPSSSTHVKGTGLGLSFVKQSAVLHSGSAQIMNAPGGGALAQLQIPLKQSNF